MVRAYVIGNFMLGLLLSVASALLFASVLPYWLIIAPMSGFLSLVPLDSFSSAAPVIAALPASRNRQCIVPHRQRGDVAFAGVELAISQVRRRPVHLNLGLPWR
jgi:hypothetical protein